MITKEQIEEFVEAKKLYNKLKKPIETRVVEVATDIARLKVFKYEDVSCDPDDTSGQVYEDGLGNTIQEIRINEGTVSLCHWDDNCMQYMEPLVLEFPVAYLYEEETFKKEVGEPLKVFTDAEEKRLAEQMARYKEQERERKRREYEKLKLEFEEQ